MESSCKPGKIQCSEDSYRLLSQEWGHREFVVKERGAIEVQDKGNMMTYWVEPHPERVENA